MGAPPMRPFKVARDGDRHALHRNVGIGTLSIKVTTADSNGAFFVAEIAHHAKGGPPRHLHHDQDEWFLVIEGENIIDIGDERYLLGPFISLSGPRGIPHCWSTKRRTRIVFVFTPAVTRKSSS